MSHEITSASPPAITAEVTPSPTASYWQRLLFRALAGMHRGHLNIELPSGVSLHLGAPLNAALPHLPQGISASASVRIHHPAFFKKCVLGGDIGFAESFLDGDWSTPDLTAVISWFIHNHDQAPTLSGSKRSRPLALNFLRLANRLSHLLRPNSLLTAQRNIREHYDLSNDFFALFLDPSLMYSSALWTHPEQSLQEAQREKNDALCRSLQLTASDRVLEIGTGWGGWSLYAAQTYGCHITTVTISQEQYDLARSRVTAAQLDHLIEVRLQDYRAITGSFDKIISIEMLEAVGHAYQPQYFACISRLLKPHGLLALQFITCPDARYDELRRNVDFIQKHIFPGSLLLSLNRVNQLLTSTGDFTLQALRDFGPDYARTLRLWREAFTAKLDQVRALGFDERFIRKWSYYLGYCEAAFALRNISVVHTLHSRANNLALA